MENCVLVAIDYYLQAVESGTSKEEASKMTHSFLFRHRNEIKRDDYYRTYEVITRLSKI